MLPSSERTRAVFRRLLSRRVAVEQSRSSRRQHHERLSSGIGFERGPVSRAPRCQVRDPTFMTAGHRQEADPRACRDPPVRRDPPGRKQGR
jgi:hypothetical protein